MQFQIVNPVLRLCCISLIMVESPAEQGFVNFLLCGDCPIITNLIISTQLSLKILPALHTSR